MRSWSSSFCNYTWRWSARRRFERREVSAPSCGWRYLPTCLDASRSSLLSAPALSPRATCFPYQTFSAALSASLHPSLNPRLILVPSHSHLSNSNLPLSISSSALYPSRSTSVGVTDCRERTGVLCRSLACEEDSQLRPPSPLHLPYPALLRIDYPTFGGDNQWA